LSLLRFGGWTSRFLSIYIFPPPPSRCSPPSPPTVNLHPLPLTSRNSFPGPRCSSGTVYFPFLLPPPFLGVWYADFFSYAERLISLSTSSFLLTAFTFVAYPILRPSSIFFKSSRRDHNEGPFDPDPLRKPPHPTPLGKNAELSYSALPPSPFSTLSFLSLRYVPKDVVPI